MERNLVQIIPNGRGQKGRSNTSRLVSAFPNSPLNIPHFSETTVNIYQELLDGNSENNSDLQYSLSHFRFDNVDLDYGYSPSYNDIRFLIFRDGDSYSPSPPASPWVPNPVSPGEQNGLNPLAKELAPDYIRDKSPFDTDTPFSGDGSAMSPHASSRSIASQSLFRQLLYGRSSR